MIVRIKDVPKNQQYKINRLFQTKRITKHLDDYGYICFDTEEYEKFKYIKRGRPSNDSKINN